MLSSKLALSLALLAPTEVRTRALEAALSSRSLTSLSPSHAQHSPTRLQPGPSMLSLCRRLFPTRWARWRVTNGRSTARAPASNPRSEPPPPALLSNPYPTRCYPTLRPPPGVFQRSPPCDAALRDPPSPHKQRWGVSPRERPAWGLHPQSRHQRRSFL